MNGCFGKPSFTDSQGSLPSPIHAACCVPTISSSGRFRLLGKTIRDCRRHQNQQTTGGSTKDFLCPRFRVDCAGHRHSIVSASVFLPILANAGTTSVPRVKACKQKHPPGYTTHTDRLFIFWARNRHTDQSGHRRLSTIAARCFAFAAGCSTGGGAWTPVPTAS